MSFGVLQGSCRNPNSTFHLGSCVFALPRGNPKGGNGTQGRICSSSPYTLHIYVLKPFCATRILQHAMPLLKAYCCIQRVSRKILQPGHRRYVCPRTPGEVWVPRLEIRAVELRGNLRSDIMKRDSSLNYSVPAIVTVIEMHLGKKKK